MPAASAGLLLDNHARKALLSASNGATPGEILLLDLDSGKRTPLLDAGAPGVEPVDLVAGAVVRFIHYDGLVLHGILYVRRDARTGDRRPRGLQLHSRQGAHSPHS